MVGLVVCVAIHTGRWWSRATETQGTMTEVLPEARWLVLRCYCPHHVEPDFAQKCRPPTLQVARGGGHLANVPDGTYKMIIDSLGSGRAPRAADKVGSRLLKRHDRGGLFVSTG